MTFQAFLESDVCVRLGWALLHSLWQLAIIGALAAITLACLRSRAHARYAVAYLTLLLMAAAPVATYFIVTPPATSLEVADVVSKTPPTALASPEPRAQSVEPAVVEVEVDVAPNGSSLYPAPLEPSEPPSESEALAPPPIEVVDLAPVSEPEPIPTTQLAKDAGWPSLAQLAAKASAWFAPFWLTGVILLSLLQLGGWVLSRRLLCTAAPLEHIELQRRLEGLMRRMGVRRAVRLLQSTLADTPLVLGVMRPALIAPVSLVTGLSVTQWEAILAHELAHIRRHDYLMNLVQIVIETLLFYHPAAWWLSRCIRAERENCCDDIAAEYCGSPVALAEGLVAIEAARLENAAVGPALAAVGPGGHDSTLRRVRRILGFSDASPKRDRTWLAGLLVLTLLTIAGVVGHRAGAQVDNSPQRARTEGVEDVERAKEATIEEAGADSQPELAGDAVSKLLPFHRNGAISLDMKSTAGGRNGIVLLRWVAFHKTEGGLHAELLTRLISYPKGKWRVTIDLLPNDDQHAEPLASADAAFENSGIVMGLPGMSTQFLRWRLGSAGLAEQATHFRVTLSPSVEQASARPVDVKGQVLDAEGRPIEALLVVRTPDDRLLPTIASDSDGRFTIPSCPSTRVALLALAQDGGFGPVAQMVEARADMEPLTLRLTVKRELRVRAADQFSKPVAPGGLRIGVPLTEATGEEDQYFWISSPYDELLADVLPETVLNANGRFVWDSAPDGPFALQVSGPNHGQAEVLVPTDSDGQVDVVMKRPVARLIANARLESGGPSTPTKIQLWPEVDHSIRFPQPGRGVIDIYENRPEYVYRITAEGYAPMTHKVLLKDVLEPSYSSITTPDGNIEYRGGRRPIGDSDTAIAATPIPSPWKVRSIGNDGLRVAASFAPVCLTPSGEAAVDADVCVQGYGMFGNSYRKPIINNGHGDSAFGTDEQGRAIIPAYIAKAGMTDRPAGGIIILHDSGYKILTRAEFAAASRITLEPWGRITGQYTVEGQMRAGQDLWLTAELHADEAIRKLFRVKDCETTDSEARFTFDRLLPGTYHVAGPDKTHAIEVKSGESVAPDFEDASESKSTLSIGITERMQGAEELPYAYRVRRATTNRFLQALFVNQSINAVEDVTGLSWPRTHIDIAKSFAGRAGPFERALSYRMGRTEHGAYMEARCKWERAVMLVRVTFEETGERVTGFWLARDKEGPTPKGFKRGGYVLGKPMMKIAGLGEEQSSNLQGLALHAKTVDEDGNPVAAPSRTTLWKRTIDPNAHAYGGADLIVDVNGVKWQYVSEFPRKDKEFTFTRLSTGVYRLTANHHANRTVMSKDIRVDGSAQQVRASLTIPDWERMPCKLSAQLLDAESGEVKGDFKPFFRLYRFGFPRVRYRYDNKYKEELDYTCELVPGVYEVDVYGGWHSIGEGSRALDRPTRFSFTVTDEGANDFTFEIPSFSFSENDDEVARRWPNVVEGIVRTADGEPVEGADVHVHGRPEERAWTTTDADGRYSLRFAPETYTTANTAARWVKHDQLDNYADVILHVEKQGYTEANLATHGRFTVVDEAPLDKDGNPLAPEKIAVRGEPFHDINFTMVPAARIYANFFRDPEGKPMDRQLVLVNADDPGLRVYERDSTVDGFAGVPTVGRWQFHTYHAPSGPHFDSSLSPVMSFPTAGSYHAFLQAVEIPEEERSHPKWKLRLKLLSLIDPNGQEIAPSPETHIMVDGERERLHLPDRIDENGEKE